MSFTSELVQAGVKHISKKADRLFSNPKHIHNDTSFLFLNQYLYKEYKT